MDQSRRDSVSSDQSRSPPLAPWPSFEEHRGRQLVERLGKINENQQVCTELGTETLAADITVPDVPERLLALALSRFSRCDVVINNAGAIEVGPIASIEIDKVCAMVRVNVEAAYRVAYTFIRHFVKHGCGKLINVSSVMGTKVRPTAGAYAGTKFAIEALSEALRMEVAGTGVSVTCIEPGLVMTDLHRNWPARRASDLATLCSGGHWLYSLRWALNAQSLARHSAR